MAQTAPQAATDHGARPGAPVRVGVAGWLYDDWKRVLYPEPAPRGFDPLDYLAHYIDAVEINSSFYGPPSARTSTRWAERVRDRPAFRFTAKLWRRFTHEREQAWSTGDVDVVRAGLTPLAEAGRLGALLIQFPWSFKRNERSREWLGDLMTAFAEFPLVLEVRHASWNVPEFYASLATHDIGFVNIDQPLFRHSIKPSATATARIGYIRLHGRNYRDWFREGAGRDARYDYLYSAQELRDWVERIDDVAADPESREVYVITNNHFRGQAVANALMLRAMIDHRRIPAPPALFDTYHAALADFAERGDE
jgi:uncharacterized protein YecE (DUF72 family)